MFDPRARPELAMAALVRLLHRHGVDWVLSGSTVLAVYGADVWPNDLDVVPDPDPDNLHRLVTVLRELDAVPAHFPGWPGGLTEEQCRAWTPAPSVDRLDHLFVTRLGLLDVPTLTGSYAGLRPGSARLELFGVPVLVCDPDEVLHRLPSTPRAKDRPRRQEYERLRERLRTDRRPLGLPRFR